MKIAAVAFTRRGAELCRKLCGALASDECVGYAPQSHAEGLLPMNAAVGKWAEGAFKTYNGIVFISACGIAVRAIAPLLQGKTKDPAVVVLDEEARFAVSLLSGHIGGANRLAERVAQAMGATPVITTATDVRGVFAVDTWALRNDLSILNPEEIKTISAALLNGDPVGLCSDFEITGSLPDGIGQAAGQDCGISISFDIKKKPFAHTLHLVPQILYLGIGCRRGVSCEQIEEAVLAGMQNAGYPTQALAGIASADLKKDEPGLLDFCRKRGFTLKAFSAQELESIPGAFSDSGFVRNIAGTGCVCERAACALAGTANLLVPKTAAGPVTIAVARSDWRVCFEYQNDGN